MVFNFVENHDYWQKIFDPFSGSQKQKYFIQLCESDPHMLVCIHRASLGVAPKSFPCSEVTKALNY